jgi:probable F420-dependent oxidoreductase
MKIDAALHFNTLGEVPALAEAAEDLGFDGAWVTETRHHAFLPLPLVAEHTRRLEFGTAVAIGFARSPVTLAHVGWDLAAQSRGRFILGLGTQVKAHIERRFGLAWPASPVGKLRELVLGIRAVWQSWQTGERLNFRGEYFKLTLMTPFFSPGPSDYPPVPIYIAGVNTGMAHLAGEVCDGFAVHPLNTPAYVREVLRPAIAAGAAKAGRPAEAVKLSASVFAITEPAERDFARQQIAFYASTPSYRPLLTHHGWDAIGEGLSALASRGAWGDMPGLVSDEMLDTCAVTAPLGEAAQALRERYEGVVDRVTLYRPFVPGQDDAGWRKMIDGMKAGER